MIYLLKGIIAGLIIAIPVGPIGVLCIRRTLMQGTFYGFISGLGAAVADSFYGLVAVFGLSFISNLILQHQFWFEIIGGLFICGMGIHAFRTKNKKEIVEVRREGLWKAFWSVFFLTLTNPITLVAAGGIFASLGITAAHKSHFVVNMLLVTGVFIGSTLWWSTISYGVGKIRHKVGDTFFIWMNRTIGSALVLLGLGMVYYSVI